MSAAVSLGVLSCRRDGHATDDDDDDDDEKEINARDALSDLVRFDDALPLVVPPFLLHLLQFFALKQVKNGHIDATPAYDTIATLRVKPGFHYPS